MSYKIKVLPEARLDIHYRIEEDSKSIIIFAVTHTSRDPQSWKKRR